MNLPAGLFILVEYGKLIKLITQNPNHMRDVVNKCRERPMLNIHDISNQFSGWILSYGSIAIFFLLVIGIVGLPIPDETLMVFAGYLIAKNQLSGPFTFIAAFAGSACGITLSYLLGISSGHYLLEKIGPKIGITHKKIQRVHDWFFKIGKWLILVGYFIPGVRHLTGYVAGMMRLPKITFVLIAYSGALIWSSLFLTLGYYFGDRIESILRTVEKDTIIIIGVGVVLLLLSGLLWRWRKKNLAKKFNGIGLKKVDAQE